MIVIIFFAALIVFNFYSSSANQYIKFELKQFTEIYI